MSTSRLVIVPRLARSCRTLARTQGLRFSQGRIQVLGFFELFDRPGRELTRSSFVRQYCRRPVVVSSFSGSLSLLYAMRIDRCVSATRKRTTRSSIVSPSMRRIDDNTLRRVRHDMFRDVSSYSLSTTKKERKIHREQLLSARHSLFLSKRRRPRRHSVVFLLRAMMMRTAPNAFVSLSLILNGEAAPVTKETLNRKNSKAVLFFSEKFFSKP